MNKIIKVQKDGITEEYYFDINDFKDLIDISKIGFYEVSMEGDKIMIKFFDKDKKQII